MRLSQALIFSAFTLPTLTGCPPQATEAPKDLLETKFGSFERRVLLTGGSEQAPTFAKPSYLRFGPNGSLFVTTYTGELYVLTIESNAVTVVKTYKPCGDRLLTGIAFDPDSSADEPALYVAHNAPPLTGGPDSTGIISRLSGPEFTEREDLITGLPRAHDNHMTFDLVFGRDGSLYIAQGGNTNNGAPSEFFGDREEATLSAAILQAAIRKEGFVGLDAVEVFASGLRNVYSFVEHSNGRLYALDQGANANLGGRPLRLGGVVDMPEHLADELNVILPDRYHGHPNPARDEYAFARDLDDGTPYMAPMMTFPIGSVTTGLAEFRSSNDTRLNGALLCTGFMSDRLRFVLLSSDGLDVVEHGVLADEFSNPIDVEVRASGTIFILEAGGTLAFDGVGPARISMLIPVTED